MKIIELTDEQYQTLLSYKNRVSMKVRQITNTDVLNNWGKHEQLMDKVDYEPGYSFGACINDTIGSVINEQETGEVNHIT